MASRQKYRKLNLGPSERVTAKNSCVGMLCISDYVDTQNSQRILVFERPAKISTEPAKPVTRRKKPAVNGADEAHSGGLAFPGESAPTA
jgi:hypothetical protein